jgi:hypothetical protein
MKLNGHSGMGNGAAKAHQLQLITGPLVFYRCVDASRTALARRGVRVAQFVVVPVPPFPFRHKCSLLSRNRRTNSPLMLSLLHKNSQLVVAAALASAFCFTKVSRCYASDAPHYKPLTSSIQSTKVPLSSLDCIVCAHTPCHVGTKAVYGRHFLHIRRRPILRCV